MTEEAIQEQYRKLLPVLLDPGRPKRVTTKAQELFIYTFKNRNNPITDTLILREIFNSSLSVRGPHSSQGRVTLSRLRVKLQDYYDTDGKNDPIIFHYPDSYALKFSPRQYIRCHRHNSIEAIFRIKVMPLNLNKHVNSFFICKDCYEALCDNSINLEKDQINDQEATGS